MKEFSNELGKLSGKFSFAEGWRRHNPLGFCEVDADPLKDLISENVLELDNRPLPLP